MGLFEKIVFNHISEFLFSWRSNPAGMRTDASRMPQFNMLIISHIPGRGWLGAFVFDIRLSGFEPGGGVHWRGSGMSGVGAADQRIIKNQYRALMDNL
jgi:hypothetical protein